MTNVTGTATGLTSGITNALKSATTTVDVSAATAPSSGQVLTATSSTTATWQTPSATSTSKIVFATDYSVNTRYTETTASSGTLTYDDNGLKINTSSTSGGRARNIWTLAGGNAAAIA